MLIVIVASLVFNLSFARAHAETIDEAASAMDFAEAFCGELVIPSRADRFASHLSLPEDDRGTVGAIARHLVDVATPDDRFFSLDVAGYEVRGLIAAGPRQIKLRIARFARAKENAEAPRGLRSPLLDVWRGLAMALFQLARANPHAHRVIVDGYAMNNAKYVRFLRRRVAFYQAHAGEADYQLVLWNVPDGRATRFHRVRFATRAVTEITRRLFWIW